MIRIWNYKKDESETMKIDTNQTIYDSNKPCPDEGWYNSQTCESNQRIEKQVQKESLIQIT